MKVYAEATCDGHYDIKKGDRVLVVEEIDNEGGFISKHPDGNLVFHYWEDSYDIQRNNWKRIEMNEEGDMNSKPIKLTNGCYTKISHLSVEDQKRVLDYYQSFGADYSNLCEDDNDFLDSLNTWPYLSWLNEEDRLSMLREDEIIHALGNSTKHIPAEDILKSLQYQGEESVPTLLEQIKKAKIAYDEAEEHLQSLLDKGHRELGDCGISFEIKL